MSSDAGPNHGMLLLLNIVAAHPAIALLRQTWKSHAIHLVHLRCIVVATVKLSLPRALALCKYLCECAAYAWFFSHVEDCEGHVIYYCGVWSPWSCVSNEGGAFFVGYFICSYGYLSVGRVPCFWMYGTRPCDEVKSFGSLMMILHCLNIQIYLSSIFVVIRSADISFVPVPILEPKLWTFLGLISLGRHAVQKMERPQNPKPRHNRKIWTAVSAKPTRWLTLKCIMKLRCEKWWTRNFLWN